MNAIAQALPADRIRIETSSATEPFWQAAKENRLVAAQCASCGHFRMPPTPFCPECQSQETNWPELSGAGVVYSFAVAYGYPGLPDLVLVPAVIGLPDAGGTRLVTNVVGVDPAQVHIGMSVSVVFLPVSEGWQLPVFRAVEVEP